MLARFRHSVPALSYRVGSIVSLALGATIFSCAEAAPVTEPAARVALSQVTPTLATSLSPDGRFILSSAVVNPPGELNEQQARSIAIRFVRDIASSLASSWVADHGAKIRVSALAPCDRAVYAASPYASLTGANISEVTLRTFGAHWVVPMCVGGQAQVIVSFSSQATELGTDVATRTALPWHRADIRSFGVPGSVSGSLFTPEGAAQRAYGVAGKRINSVPTLIMNLMPTSPQLVRWQVDLEAPITVKGARSGTSRARSTVLVGFGETFKETGLLDTNAQGEPPALTWTDAVTKEPFVLALVPRAVKATEFVIPENP